MNKFKQQTLQLLKYVKYNFAKNDKNGLLEMCEGRKELLNLIHIIRLSRFFPTQINSYIGIILEYTINCMQLINYKRAKKDYKNCK